jgi:hypothetical protein
MIDLFIVTSKLGTPQAHHQSRISTVTYSRFSTVKTKRAITYINSPITDAQMELMYWVEEEAGAPIAYVRIKLPLASATMGHNFMHAGLDSIGWELVCGKLLCKVILTVLGFQPEEINCFFENAIVELLELTWHTETASPKALRSLQRRIKAHFDGLRSAKSRHDIKVSDVHYRESNGAPALLVVLKSQDQYRAYGKIDEVSSRAKRSRKPSEVSPEVKQYLIVIKDAIKHHLRNEPRIVGETLKARGMSHPRAWTLDNIKALIDDLWKDAGLGGRDELAGLEKLSPESLDTWERYFAGENPKEFLPPHSMTRHRQLILEAIGKDIARSLTNNKVNSASVGYQQQYDRRWEPKGELRKLVLCEETAPAIQADLRSGLAFLESGEVPEFLSDELRTSWFARWASFADREGGPRNRTSPPRLDQSSALPEAQDIPSWPANKGIGTVPVEPGAKDEWILIDGEWQVR